MNLHNWMESLIQNWNEAMAHFLIKFEDRIHNNI